ncbi:uncharacterized protein LOC119402595 [Rhipicephalus sanguineus]|uniref:Transcription factor Adf-1 n=1 Tax=Rhipicephalus sanguineus TaxID=34632 RepID=A0A9D4PFS2_RHISA|nr:uncharacterized protein LOC119402595 [Rhipicephalus sanguineus]KAH7940140.1 hypothetical protein HPB52_022055 [Rhipicephalus sanguineus]
MASFNERLVHEVKKHKQLWDQHSKLHKEAGFREAAWLDIATALAVSVEECQTRWRTIRDTYLKRKKRRRSDAKGQWNVLDRELSFLDEFLRPRTRRCALRLSAMPPVKSELPEGDPCEASAADEANNWVPPPQQHQQPMAILPHNPQGAALQERAGDPDELFCLSLAAQLKRLLPRERNVAKMKMLRLLHDLEFGEPEGGDAHREP